VRSRTRVDAEVIGAGARGRLRVIARAGVGLDNIDVEAARRHGILVVNAAEAPVESVAELTVGLMIAAARRVVELNGKLREGVWAKEYGFELYGKTLLIVGFGRIGRRVAQLTRALGMRVLAYDVVDVSEHAARLGVKVIDNLCEGLAEADVVSLHVPLTRDTWHMINSKTLRCFKRGTILVNTARGAVVDTEAVLAALEDGTLYAYAADVLEHEPPGELEMKLVRHPRAIITPHIGSQTFEAQERIARVIAEKLADILLEGGHAEG
jgi:D-3-phosphoglycerate dehydrogenase